jgi:hypothetical protein
MDTPRLRKTVRSVIKLERDRNGTIVPTVLYEAETKKKKKSSAALKPAERLARRVARTQAKFADTYLSKHESSNEDRRDGWIRDLGRNVSKAEYQARKTFTKNSTRWPMLIRFN